MRLVFIYDITRNFMNIYVANLSYQTTEEELREIFEEYGPVTSVNIIKDRYTSKSRGFGFVEMTDEAGSKKAIDELHGKEYHGRALNINEARPRQPRD